MDDIPCSQSLQSFIIKKWLERANVNWSKAYFVANKVNWKWKEKEKLRKIATY